MKINFNIFKRNSDKTAPTAPSPIQNNEIGLRFGNIMLSKEALLLSAVYRCVNVISDSIAQLPIKTYIEKNSYLHEYKTHPVYGLLYGFPNRNISRFTLIKNMICDMLLQGNAYAFIEREVTTQQPKAIHYIPSGYVSIQYDQNNILFPDIQYIVNGFNRNILPEDMIHILNYSADGISGISTLRHAILSTDISLSSEQHAKNFFTSGANLAGILTVESSLTDEQRKNIIQKWNDTFKREVSGNGAGIAVLQGNMKYSPLTVNPTDAQLLETRKFNITDIARFFGVSPTKLFDYTNSSYSTVEATQLAFLTDTITPVLQKFELEFERKLFLPIERNSVDVRFDTSTLVRLDVTAQSNYYKNLYQMSAITPNEIRREILKNPIDGGDNVFVQGAMTTLDNVIKGVNYTKGKEIE